MATVQVTREQPRFRRSVNGAWLSDVPDKATFTLKECDLANLTVGTDNLTVTWPDGHKESMHPFNGGAFPGYAPILIPANGRLAAARKPT